MFFSWWKHRRRRKILNGPFPADWETILHEGVRHDLVLPETERVKLRQAVRIIIAEKDWEGCRGLEVTDEVRVVIAAQAAILVLGMDDFYFENVQTILVYPDPFTFPQDKYVAPDLNLHEEEDALGLTQRDGTVLLAWNEVREHAINPGCAENLVFHEFAHQLDYSNGAADGTPKLATAELAERWSKIMDHEYRRLQRAERKGRATLLDPYGASDPAEFFAVTTECFFDAPQAMRDEYPDLYALFSDYYRQNPAAWRAFS